MTVTGGARKPGKRSYGIFVAEDLAAIDARAMTLYALSDLDVPWPLAYEHDRKKFTERAARELWEEGALHLDPSQPYYEPTH